ncbi:DUF1931 domain-containing protein [Candidatus Woesearchaeota archaeon]|nr:DUF1931 domain-containing protein [Candidatus Woesearchaeota archaeon]
MVHSNIKEYARVNDKQLFLSADFTEKLNQKAIELIREAARRAKENQRNTVMGRDL